MIIKIKTGIIEIMKEKNKTKINPKSFRIITYPPKTTKRSVNLNEN